MNTIDTMQNQHKPYQNINAQSTNGQDAELYELYHNQRQQDFRTDDVPNQNNENTFSKYNFRFKLIFIKFSTV